MLSEWINLKNLNSPYSQINALVLQLFLWGNGFYTSILFNILLKMRHQDLNIMNQILYNEWSLLHTSSITAAQDCISLLFFFFWQLCHNIGSHSVCSKWKFLCLHPETDVKSNLFVLALVQLVFWNYVRTDQKIILFHRILFYFFFCLKKFASMPLIAQFCYHGNTVSCYYFLKPYISHHQLVPFVFQLVCNTKVVFFLLRLFC